MGRSPVVRLHRHRRRPVRQGGSASAIGARSSPEASSDWPCVGPTASRAWRLPVHSCEAGPFWVRWSRSTGCDNRPSPKSRCDRFRPD